LMSAIIVNLGLIGGRSEDCPNRIAYSRPIFNYAKL
jgi:hypothetical protein